MGVFLKTNVILWGVQHYEALDGGGWVAKTFKKNRDVHYGRPLMRKLLDVAMPDLSY